MTEIVKETPSKASKSKSVKVPTPREIWNTSALKYGFNTTYDKEGIDEERVVLKRYAQDRQGLANEFKRVMVTMDNPTFIGILREIIRHG